MIRKLLALIVTLAIIGCSTPPVKPVMAQATKPATVVKKQEPEKQPAKQVKQAKPPVKKPPRRNSIDAQIRAIDSDILVLEYQRLIGRIAERKLRAIEDNKANKKDGDLAAKVKAEIDKRTGGSGK